jgi:TM2 domain-containing membrane protein YozV
MSGQLEERPQKSKMVAGILGILLGGLGVHQFYLGNTSQGIVRIVVTALTCGLGGIWGLIEGIMILTGSINQDAEGRPLKD